MIDTAVTDNLIINGDFRQGRAGKLPAGWECVFSNPVLAPSFRLGQLQGQPVLAIAGNGDDDCVGYLRSPVNLEGGCGYELTTRFRMSAGVNPQQHLVFALYAGDFNNGIFHFRRLPDQRVEGTAHFLLPGEGLMEGDMRIYFRQSPRGKVWVEEVRLQRCAPPAPRWVRLACTNGLGTPADWANVLDTVGREGCDLALLPETLNGEVGEPLDGPYATLMAEKAATYRMSVAGGLLHDNREERRLDNLALLYDRQGTLVGQYAKIHPYTPEFLQQGIVPGRTAPVFQTDIGKIGFIICYDSWFTDVVELLALRGAELVLFPNGGYYRSLLPARAADNGVRILASSWGSGYGLWDTAGREALAPDADPTCNANHPPVVRNVRTLQVGPIAIMLAEMDLQPSFSPHNWGGPLLSAPGGRRNRREQHRFLYPEIQKEQERWWEE